MSNKFCRNVYEKVNSYMEEVDKKIKQNIQYINQEFERDNRQNERFRKNIRLEFDQETVIRKRENNDFIKEMKKVGANVKDTYSVINSILSDFEKIGDLVAGLLEDIQMQQALDIQDELDKKNISLFGVAEKKTKFDFHEALNTQSKEGELTSFDKPKYQN